MTCQFFPSIIANGFYMSSHVPRFHALDIRRRIVAVYSTTLTQPADTP
jgi:hypothetical protein